MKHSFVRSITVMTGSTSQLGDTVLRRLTAARHYVITIGRRPSAINSNLRGSHIVADLSRQEGIKQCVNKLKIILQGQPSSRINIVHMATQYPIAGSDGFSKQIYFMFNIHAATLWHLCNTVEQFWNERRGGAVLAISSNLTIRPTVKMAAYICTKSAMESLCKSLALKFGKYKVCCNTISPGLIPSSALDKMTASKLKNIAARTPLNRISKTDDIANLILLLVSSKAEWMTGQNLIVDGGNSIGW